MLGLGTDVEAEVWWWDGGGVMEVDARRRRGCWLNQVVRHGFKFDSNDSYPKLMFSMVP